MKTIFTLTFLAISLLAGLPGCSTPRVLHERIEWSDIWIVNANGTELPRVLLVGDSIVRGYYGAVEKELSGRADCARYTTSLFLSHPDYLAELALLLDRFEFAVIHVNNGLHGWDYTEAEYEEGLLELLRTIRRHAPDAALIWCASTPVRKAKNLSELNTVRNDRVIERNRIAAAIMNDRAIPINDLYSAMKDRPGCYSNDGVHFNNEGRRLQAQAVAGIVRKSLEID